MNVLNSAPKMESFRLLYLEQKINTGFKLGTLEKELGNLSFIRKPMKWEFLIQQKQGEKMQNDNSEIEIVESVETDATSFEETEEILLARLYDLCISLGKRVQISSVETDDENKQEIIIIVVKDTKYSEEKGFEKTQ